MNGIITHEESQVVTDAFRNKGNKFYSNDIIDCSGNHPEWHYQGDVFDVLEGKINRLDFLGCHPVCQYLSNSGVRWLASVKSRKGYEWSEKYQIHINWVRFKLMEEAAEHFGQMLNIVKIVGKGYVENPIMHKYATEIIGAEYTQIIQPYQFGHKEQKATCLWLVNLPELQDTNNVYKEMMKLPYSERAKVHYAPPGPERAKARSKTYKGVAEAMADQWG